MRCRNPQWKGRGLWGKNEKSSSFNYFLWTSWLRKILLKGLQSNLWIIIFFVFIFWKGWCRILYFLKNHEIINKYFQIPPFIPDVKVDLERRVSISKIPEEIKEPLWRAQIAPGSADEAKDAAWICIRTDGIEYIKTGLTISFKENATFQLSTWIHLYEEPCHNMNYLEVHLWTLPLWVQSFV